MANKNKNKSKNFEQWLKEVNNALIEKCSLGYMDLPDCSYAQWFEDGITPKQAAARAIKNAKES